MKNSKGIHPSIYGETGTGKTDCCRAMLHLMPKEYKLDTNLSDKVLFYYRDLKEGTVIFSDDAKLSEDLESTIKKATSKFQSKTKHKTLKGGEVKSLSIPPRISWWLTSVDEKYSEELLNRQFRVSVDDSLEQNLKVDKFQKKMAKKGKSNFRVSKRVKICREIFREIKSRKPLKVIIPYASRIKFKDISNRRSNEIFYDMIKAFAVIKYKSRDTDKNGNLIANERDFERAASLFNKYAATQITGLKQNELKICEILSTNQGLMTIKDLALKMGLSEDAVRKIMHGRDRNKKNGLIDKVPDIKWYKGIPYQYNLKNFNKIDEAVKLKPKK